jgi:hypothetical protein
MRLDHCRGADMPAAFVTALGALALCLAAIPAAAEEPVAAATDTAAAADTAAATAAADTATIAKAADDDALHLPPGFKPKKRGKYMLYCRKETVMGTRFPVEKCYDEAGIRELIRAQIENQEQLDQMRRICSTAGACGSN